MICFGPKSSTNAVSEYLAHYHAERNHQGMGNLLIEADEEFVLCLEESTAASDSAECSSTTAAVLREPSHHHFELLE